MASATVSAVPASAKRSTHAKCSASAVVASNPEVATAAVKTLVSGSLSVLWPVIRLLSRVICAVGHVSAVMRFGSMLSVANAAARASMKLACSRGSDENAAMSPRPRLLDLPVRLLCAADRGMAQWL